MSEPSESQEEKRGRKGRSRGPAKATKPVAERGKKTARRVAGSSRTGAKQAVARGGAASPRPAPSRSMAEAQPALKPGAVSKSATARAKPPASVERAPAPRRRLAAPLPREAEASAPRSARRASPKKAEPKAVPRAPVTPPAGATKRAAKASPRRKSSRSGRRRAAPARVSVRGPAPTPVTEEERIESSKYLARDIPKRRRRFEEERFLFPETYEVDRVRLLVKDPEWLFAHWDVSPGAWKALHEELGERAMALSKLTLRVEDPSNGALTVILLPHGARNWYLRTQAVSRAYRAELGLTTPSGAFRAIATSNTVVTPRVGPSPERAIGVGRFGRPEPGVGGGVAGYQPVSAPAAGAPGGLASRAATSASPDSHGGWPGAAPPVELIDASVEDAASAGPAGPEGPEGPEGGLPERGGASDAFGPRKPGKARGGASDLYRR
jgi:hypothetical protein